MLSLPIAVKVSINKPKCDNKAGNPDIFGIYCFKGPLINDTRSIYLILILRVFQSLLCQEQYIHKYNN